MSQDPVFVGMKQLKRRVCVFVTDHSFTSVVVSGITLSFTIEDEIQSTKGYGGKVSKSHFYCLGYSRQKHR